MGGAQINANGNAPLVWVRGLAGFGNLKKRHEKGVLKVVKASLNTKADFQGKKQNRWNVGSIVPVDPDDVRCRWQIAQ